MKTPLFSILILGAVLLLTAACGASPQDLAAARQTNAVTNALEQTFGQQQALVQDLQSERNRLSNQNLKLVDQLANTQQIAIDALQSETERQAALVNLLVIVLALVALPLAFAVVAFVITSNLRMRQAYPQTRVLPAARGYRYLPDGRVEIIDATPKSVVPYREP